jgi:hypothetical protein
MTSTLVEMTTGGAPTAAADRTAPQEGKDEEEPSRPFITCTEDEESPEPGYISESARGTGEHGRT